MIPRARVVFIGLLSALGTVGCGADPAAGPPGNTSGRTLRATPSFAVDVQEIFARRGCSQAACHGATAPLPLTPTLTYDHLVGIPATAEPGLRVQPGAPGNSYLMRRLEGTQRVGSRMPLGGAPLDSIDLGNIGRWIEKGARRN